MLLPKPPVVEPFPTSTLGRLPPKTDHFLVALLSLAFLPYFVTRGWLSAAMVLIGLYCLYQVCTDISAARNVLKQRPLAWMAIAFAFPLLAVVVVQISHRELVPRYLEMPVRMLFAGIIMVYMAQRQVNFVRVAEVVFPSAALLCALTVYLIPNASQFYWNERVATAFIDPLTLSQHILIVGFICLFSVDVMGKDKIWLKTLKYAGVLAAAAVSVGTQSRTGWTMVPILAIVWLVGVKQYNNPKRKLPAGLLVAIGCIAIYMSSDIVKTRIDTAFFEIYAYFYGGDRETSLGLRLSMFRTNWLLFWEKPLFGWGFKEPPSLLATPEIASLATPLLQQFFIHSGGHNEFLQGMMRMGIWGLISRLALVLVPLIIFIQAAKSLQRTRRAAGYFGIAVTVGYLTAGLTSEVFNLIYAASFYALLVSALVASTTIETRYEQA